MDINADDGQVMGMNDCIVLPQCCTVNAGDVRDVPVIIPQSKTKERT